MVISRVVFGCAAMGGYDYGAVSDAESIGAVHRAIDLGINSFDTADIYGFGHAERVLGRAMIGRRSKVVIATKGGVRRRPGGGTFRTLDPEVIVCAVEESLQRLKTDYIDLYQLHWPVPGAQLDSLGEALLRLRTSGKILAVGCCNFTHVDAQHLARAVPVAAVQHSFNLIDRTAEDDIDLCRRSGRLTLTYNSLAQGLLAGARRALERFSPPDLRSRSGYFRSSNLNAYLQVVERVEEVARRRSRSNVQVALRWALDHPSIGGVIAGIKHAWQVEENAGVFGWHLCKEDREYLEAEIAGGV